MQINTWWVISFLTLVLSRWFISISILIVQYFNNVQMLHLIWHLIMIVVECLFNIIKGAWCGIIVQSSSISMREEGTLEQLQPSSSSISFLGRGYYYLERQHQLLLKSLWTWCSHTHHHFLEQWFHRKRWSFEKTWWSPKCIFLGGIVITSHLFSESPFYLIRCVLQFSLT